MIYLYLWSLLKPILERWAIGYWLLAIAIYLLRILVKYVNPSYQ